MESIVYLPFNCVIWNFVLRCLKVFRYRSFTCLVKFIAMNFILFEATVNKVVFFISLSDSLLLMYANAKSLQSCPTLCDPIDGSPPGSAVPGDSPGKNTGVGCHFLLQCVKEKSESEVAQSCPTLSDPMDCSLPGSSVHGFSRQEYWSGISF